MPDSVTQFSGGFYAVPNATATQTAAYTDGVLVSSIAVNRSASVPLTAITAIDTTAAGVKFSNYYTLRSAYSTTMASQVRGRIRWITAAVSPAGATGRVNLDIRRKDTSGNITSISGVTKGSGKPRALDAGIGTIYTDNQIVVNLPSITLAPGESIVAVVEFEVIATAAGNTLAVSLKTDPDTAGEELVVEFDVGQP
jgi:hypothetical protein